MSKIGQRKINIPQEVKIEEEDKKLKVTGPKGTLSLELPSRISLQRGEDSLLVQRAGSDRRAKSFHGLYHKLIANMIEGVSIGFTKKLDFNGVGFRAEISGNKLVLNVGFSHLVEYPIPEDIEIKVEKNVISVKGISRQKVGQVAAEIRAIKPVEPYKGKGIKYIDEIPRRKAGKTAKAAVAGSK